MGTDIAVAVLDTGILPHQDLAGKILPGYGMIKDRSVSVDEDGRDDDATDPGDWNEAGECSDQLAMASSWHGTHVSGTVAAVTNNLQGVGRSEDQDLANEGVRTMRCVHV